MTDHRPSLQRLRDELPITQEFAYFQTGSYAPVPRSTLRLMADLMTRESIDVIARGSKGAGSEYETEANRARDAFASAVGVPSASFAWTENTTRAIRLAVLSLSWAAGDLIALTDIEHASTVEFVRGLEERFGVRTTIVPTGSGPEYDPTQVLVELQRRLTPQHRLLIMSHVANTDGRRLPVTEATAFARNLGVPTLIDGAQALGGFPVDVGAIDADFYAGSAHKWLMGPAGVGFLIVAARRMPEYNPNALPIDGAGKRITAGTRSELGTANQVLRMGAAHSLGLLQAIGLNRVEERARSLTDRLRQGLRAIPGVVNAGADTWPCSSGITTVQFDAHTEARCRAVVELLRDEYRIVTKFRPELCGVRVSVAAFNSEEEIDRLLNALERMIRRS